ncbi:hypothetical protein PVAP13_4KG338900 [Panicum virgatum]|uniref:Uncharacterized protein n=1 Tax=Panicum virgatum TaxID=38727 RepID=A0A8T0TMR7_PANVG|nr:hypothetical protein PVAP13_4KG338900 [Panicum virgatum]
MLTPLTPSASQRSFSPVRVPPPCSKAWSNWGSEIRIHAEHRGGGGGDAGEQEEDGIKRIEAGCEQRDLEDAEPREEVVATARVVGRGRKGQVSVRPSSSTPSRSAAFFDALTFGRLLRRPHALGSLHPRCR